MTNNELYHWGVKGMKWGKRKTIGTASKQKTSAYKKVKQKKTEKSVYQQERERQKKHLATKRAIDIGSRVVNEYTKRNNVTINGMHAGVHDNAKLLVNKLLDYKYMKDTFK